MKRILVFTIGLLCIYQCIGQLPDRATALKLDSLITRYLDSVRKTNVYQAQFFLYSKDTTDRVQAIADKAKDSLLIKYLYIFDSLFRKGDIYPEKGAISSPTQKIRYLIGYCFLSNIYPTRTYMEALLEANPLILFTKTAPPDCRIINPYPIRFKRKTIKKLKEDFYSNYFTDQISFSEIYHQMESRSAPGKISVTQAGNEINTYKSKISYESEDYFWKIVFCVFDVNGDTINNKLSITYHSYGSEKVVPVYGAATPAYASLPPGEIYLQVTRLNSTVPLKIKQNVIYVRDEIKNAWDRPSRNTVLDYNKSKSLSRENTFIIHIRLVR